MSHFLKETVKSKSFELLIDTGVFPKDIILKASYNFLDQMYVFFKYDDNRNIILEGNIKPEANHGLSDLVSLFSDELLNTYLRDKLEKENRVIRETIVNKSLLGPIDSGSHVSHDPENPVSIPQAHEGSTEIDFNKDIDEIIKEIENDPDLQIDEDEIQQMLREIEEETANESLEEIDKPVISIDPDSVNDIKKQFKKNKKTKKK